MQASQSDLAKPTGLRGAIETVVRWFGPQEPAGYRLSRWIFLRALAVVYLIAFVSLGVQVIGLVGADGILPLADYLARARETAGVDAYRLLPTLSWLSAADSFTRILCWGGVTLSLLLILGLAPRLVLFLLWAFYLSLTVDGQVFLSFQWDALLLETGLLAILFAPGGWRPTLRYAAEPPAAARWLLWLLLFKLMFLSGITKIVSGDPAWANWTALDFHYETQPLPTWTAWYAHHLPDWAHRGQMGFMYLAELVAPFFIFVPGRFRIVRFGAAAVIAAFQLAIAATGNYGFFNLLALVLCVPLLDDRAWLRILPGRLAERARRQRLESGPSVTRTRIVGALAVIIVFFSALAFVREIARSRPDAGAAGGRPGWTDRALAWVEPFRSINGYGLFRVMTRERPEIVIEGSVDGTTWEPFEFRWKPGAVDERPRFVQPHMPRLDWQMWFAALDPRGSQRWLAPLLERLLDGEPAVIELLGETPFGRAAPNYVRLVLYRYRFTSPEGRDETGAWWRREFVAQLTRAVGRR